MIKKPINIDSADFRKKLLYWFKENKRELPWRSASGWYPVFLSEFLLQQTQVEQALPYYHKFIGRFADILSLSRASEQDVLTLWAGLGYYTRARNLLKAAKIIVNEHDAVFPSDFKTSLKLPGVGKYTASAILSIAFNKKYAVTDGNVFRVVSRIYAISDDLRLTRTQIRIQELCDQLISKKNPGDFNEAIMELGSTICRKKDPDCINCPLKEYCRAFIEQNQSRYPFKSASSAKRKVKHFVSIIKYQDKFLLVQRPSSGLLASMWEFPVVEVNNLNLKKRKLESLILAKYNLNDVQFSVGEMYRHQYSHIDLSYKPVFIFTAKNKTQYPGTSSNFVWCPLEEIDKLPVHNAHIKLLGWIKNLNR